MSFRNLSPHQMFELMALEHVPSQKFSAETPEEFSRWKDETLPLVIGTLGTLPEAVPLNPQLLAEWQDNGLRRQKWLIDVGHHISATMLVNYPPGSEGGDPLPAIFCLHGHGPYGKTEIMSSAIPGTPMGEYIVRGNNNFGFQMAQRGYVTYSLDWIGFGERNDREKPNWRSQANTRDWCNLYYLNATMLGMTSLGINIVHGRAATDFVTKFAEVDANRLGVMGISGGGAMTLWSALCDSRFKAMEIICYSDLFAHFGFRDLNYCGMQIAPGLFSLVDVPDLQGLLAPNPLLVNIATEDECFLVDTAMACFNQVKDIYRVSGSEDRLELDIFPGGHSWGGNKSEAFFGKWL